MNRKFWKDKKVILTGHTGFKGSWLSLWLQSLEAQVIGYSLPPPSKPSLFEVADVGKGMNSIKGDVRDFNNLRAVVNKHRPEILIHMAAQSLVRYSYMNPLETYGTNVMGTVNVLEVVRNSDFIRAAVIVTSDKCYENKEWVWGYRENDPMGGHDPYSSSKGCAELITSAYRNSYFLNEGQSNQGISVASVRAGNVIGGGDWSMDRLIPDIMNAIMKKRSVVIRNPHAIRPWQYVLEPLRGYLMLAEALWSDVAKYSGSWNFGSNDEDSREVSWIADYITHLWGKDAKWELDSGVHPHETRYLKLDCSKAKNKLRWFPRLDLSTALKWIVQWYRMYNKKGDMRMYTMEEISRYEEQIGMSS